MLLAFLLFAGNSYCQEQKHDELSNIEIEAYKDKVKQLMSFLEFSLNTLGNDSIPAREKDIIINNSYLKAFQSEKVQIEDDLDERMVITNKNAQAYLQDVDYFFKDAKFEFIIDDITHHFNDDKKLFFKVTLTRNLRGVTIDGDTVHNNKQRYIEVNLDSEKKELKIASIYTTRQNEEEDLKFWWSEMSVEWKEVFKKEIGNIDTINYGQLKRLTNTEKIDISSNKNINSLGPLNKLIKLKELNISGTNVNNLSPIRSLTRLEVIVCDNTSISSLAPLKYSLVLKELSCNNTQIGDLETVKNFLSLQKLYCNNTPVNNLDPLSGLVRMTTLRCSNTSINDLNSLRNLTNLEFLDFSNTKVLSLEPLINLINLQQLYFANTNVNDLNPLKDLEKLKIIDFNGTQVNSLSSLNNLDSLEKVYCDNTQVNAEEASVFARIHPKILIVYESEELTAWWNSLTKDWKEVFRKYSTIGDTPTKEELAAVLNITLIDISENQELQDLTPLNVLKNLKDLKLRNTKIKNLEPIANLVYMQDIDFSNTEVNNLKPLERLNDLQSLNCNNTKVDTIQIKKFINKFPSCIVVYKTAYLNDWWNSLSKDWQGIFREHTAIKDTPSDIQLHRLIRLDSINISNKQIENLNPLVEFPDLRVLQFSNTQVHDLLPLRNLSSLSTLQCSRNPIKDLKPIQQLLNLKYLNCENTVIHDLSPLKKLSQLKILKCSGTRIKNLKPLSELSQLEFLDCSNTAIRSLNALKELRQLKYLICYNTNISKWKIIDFKKDNPHCEITYY